MKEALYDYIMEVLSSNNKNIDDILWIGNSEYIIPINNFLEKSKQIEFRGQIGGLDGYPRDTLIVGDGWWLEYDDSDECEVQLKFCLPPVKPKSTHEILSLVPQEDYPELTSNIPDFHLRLRLDWQLTLSELIQVDKYIKSKDNINKS